MGREEEVEKEEIGRGGVGKRRKRKVKTDSKKRK